MSDFFAPLPPEIRNTIYEYALLRPEVYPYEYRSSVRAGTNTAAEPGETSSVVRHDVQTIPGNKSTGSYNRRVRKCGVLHAINACSDPPLTALLRACKRFYLEATAMVYMRNTFVFFRLNSLQRFHYHASQTLFNAITNVRFEHIDQLLLAPEDSARIMEFAQEIIQMIGRIHIVKHLQVKFHAVNRTTCHDRMVRRHILRYLELRRHLSRGVDTHSVYEDFLNARQEFLFDYQHLQDVECDGYGSRGPKSMRGYGTVKIFINGSNTLDWEEDCAWLRND